MSDAIVIENVRKTFGPKVAVDGLSLRVPAGSLCGFIGPNGAGKTTTIRMIMSIIFPDSGSISVLGRRSALESKDRIGYLPEERGLYRKMKVAPFLQYMAKLKGLHSADAAVKVKQWLDRLGLGEAGKKKCEELSKGMQQKVQFIAAVIHEPELLILDEVFSGLDPVNRRLIRELIDEQHHQGRTIVFSTHAMYEAEQLCDRIFMIHRGQKMLDATLSEIQTKYDARTVIIEPATRSGQEQAVLGSIPGVTAVTERRDGYHLIIGEQDDPRGIMSAAMQLVPVRRAEVKRVSLEEVFINVVAATGEQVTFGEGDADLVPSSVTSGPKAGGES